MQIATKIICIPCAGMTVSRCDWSTLILSPLSTILITALYKSFTSCINKKHINIYMYVVLLIADCLAKTKIRVLT